MEIERVEQEVVQGLPDQRSGQGGRREISKIVGDDHIGAAGQCCGDYVPVIRIGQLYGLGERFPVHHQRIWEGRLHLPIQVS